MIDILRHYVRLKIYKVCVESVKLKLCVFMKITYYLKMRIFENYYYYYYY